MKLYTLYSLYKLKYRFSHSVPASNQTSHLHAFDLTFRVPFPSEQQVEWRAPLLAGAYCRCTLPNLPAGPTPNSRTHLRKLMGLYTVKVSLLVSNKISKVRQLKFSSLFNKGTTKMHKRQLILLFNV
jgi:hypothetical protein